MRVLFALPGFHRVHRGAEVALQAVACEFASDPTLSVTVAGTGPMGESRAYEYVQLPVIPRERLEWLPGLPLLRDEYGYEEATFAPGLARWYRPGDFDVTVTCSYPFVNWVLRRGRQRPPHVFVTQNGDWPAQSNDAEFRFFGCDGLVCTNPGFYERNRERWPSVLIPNGVDTSTFTPGPSLRSKFGLPDAVPVVLMVSALTESKRVPAAIRAVAEVSDAHLLVAGDGPLRDEVDELAGHLMPGRFTRTTVSSSDMPDLYRCADVFLHMRLHESFGNVYVEALSTGLPIVAHRSETLEWILGEHGDLIDTESHSELVSALHRACSTTPVTAEVTRRHEAAIERFGWSRIAHDYRTFVEEVVGG